MLSRLFAHVPTDAVGAFCGATAVLAALCHLALRGDGLARRDGQWLAVVAMGLGPVGAAFFAWDIGMKRGDIRTLGACALPDAVAVDLSARCLWPRRSVMGAGARGGADHRRRGDCVQGPTQLTPELTRDQGGAPPVAPEQRCFQSPRSRADLRMVSTRLGGIAATGAEALQAAHGICGVAVQRLDLSLSLLV